MSIHSELGHQAMPINFLAYLETRWHKRVSNPGPLDPESYALPLRHTGWGFVTDMGINVCLYSVAG